MNQSVNFALSSNLKTLYRSNAAVSALLDLLGERKRDFAETSAPRAAYLTGIPYYDMVAGMRALDQAGAGTFIPGRHGRKTRIAWEYSARSLAAAARGEGQPIEVDPEALPVDDETDEEDAEVDAATAVTAAGDTVHEFQLRSNRRVRFVLPDDLTQRESERLAAFVRSLPYEDGSPG